jgi:hypothetical protein
MRDSLALAEIVKSSVHFSSFKVTTNMDFPKLLIGVFLLVNFSVATVFPRSNLSSLPPLKPQGKKGTGVVQLPLTKVEKISNSLSLNKRQDPSVIYNINIGYVIQSRVIPSSRDNC